MSVRQLAGEAGAPQEARAQVCVIGAGPAGLMLARRLAKTGVSVIVLESGLRGISAAHQALNEVEDVHGRMKGARHGRARALGGASLLWGGRMLPLAAHDMGPRPHIGAEAWPISPAALAPYGREVETLLGVDASSYEEDVRALLDRRGLLRVNDDDIALRFPKWAPFRLCNLASLFSSELTALPNLDVWLGATAVGFEIDAASGRVAGVLARNLSGREVIARAEQFVFAAGAIETVRLALLLDRETRGRAFDGCAALGVGLQEHMGVNAGVLNVRDRGAANRWFGYHFLGATRRNMHLELTETAQQRAGAASAYAQVMINMPEQSPLGVIKNALRGLQRGRVDLPPRALLTLAGAPFALMQLAYWRYVRGQLHLPASVGLTLDLQAEQMADPENRVTLSDRNDAMGAPRARIYWRPTERDERALRACVAATRAYWTRAGLDEIAPISWIARTDDPAKPLIDIAFDLYHPSGGAVMGADRARSVVDANLRCHHVPNLTLVSAATFPTAGSANPTYTIMCLALRAADRLARELRAA